MNSLVDPQQNALYDWEDFMFDTEENSLSDEATVGLVRRLWSELGCPQHPSPVVKLLEDPDQPSSGGLQCISLAYGHRNPYIVAHELSHAVCILHGLRVGREPAGHGPTFCAIYCHALASALASPTCRSELSRRLCRSMMDSGLRVATGLRRGLIPALNPHPERCGRGELMLHTYLDNEGQWQRMLVGPMFTMALRHGPVTLSGVLPRGVSSDGITDSTILRGSLGRDRPGPAWLRNGKK